MADRAELGGKEKLRSAVRFFNAHKEEYSAEKRARIKAQILSAARKMGMQVELAVPVADTGRTRQFTEAKHVRGYGGKFGAKADVGQASKQQTAKTILESLSVGDGWSIPGIEGSIKKTPDGYEITGPNGFKATASNVVEAMSVAARLIRSKQGKEGESK